MRCHLPPSSSSSFAHLPGRWPKNCGPIQDFSRVGPDTFAEVLSWGDSIISSAVNTIPHILRAFWTQFNFQCATSAYKAHKAVFCFMCFRLKQPIEKCKDKPQIRNKVEGTVQAQSFWQASLPWASDLYIYIFCLYSIFAVRNRHTPIFVLNPRPWLIIITIIHRAISIIWLAQRFQY